MTLGSMQNFSFIERAIGWASLGLTLDVLTVGETFSKVRKMAKIRNRCNQVPHLTQDTNGKVTTSKLDITNKRQAYLSLEVDVPTDDHPIAS